MIDILVLSNSQFRATFPFWQGIINQTSPLLGCSPWKITLKLSRTVMSQGRSLCVYRSLYSHTPHFLTQVMERSKISASSYHSRGGAVHSGYNFSSFSFCIPGVLPVAHVCFDQSRNEVTQDQWCLELPQPLPEHKPCAMEPCLYRLVFLGAQLNSCFSLPLNPRLCIGVVQGGKKREQYEVVSS